MMPWTTLWILALGFCVLVLAALLRAVWRRQAFLTLEDVLCFEGSQATLHVETERPILPLLDPAIPNVPVECFVDETSLGELKSDFSGVVEWTWLPLRAGSHGLRARISPSARWKGEPVDASAYVVPAGRPLFICDVDETISDMGNFLQALTPFYRIPPVPGARDAVERISKGYQILYLSARDHVFLAKTRRWLRHNGFPAGPVFLRRIRYGRLSPQRHKELRLAEILRGHEGARLGIGDRWADVLSYRASGVVPIWFRPRTRSLAEDIRTAARWDEVEAIAREVLKGK